MSTTEQLLASLQSIDPASFAGEDERKKVKEALLEAYRKVQVPWEITWELVLENVFMTTAAKTLIDIGLFTKWAERKHEPTTSAEFARLTGADEKLIRRMLLLLSSRYIVDEIAENTFGPTSWTKAFEQDPAVASCFGAFYTANSDLGPKFPAYIKKCGYKLTTDPKDCNFQYVYGQGSMPFSHISADPQRAKEMNEYFGCHSRYDFLPWTSMYPTETILSAAAAEPDASPVLVVDVGGNKGHDLEKFRLRHPDVPAGSLVLQDLEGVLKAAPALDKTISAQPHNFFDPQPVKGARAYFLHNIIHDWSDAESIEILKNIAAAMKKGYSRVLLHECIVAPFKPGARLMVSDVCMMMWFAARERYETEMEELLRSAGLRLLKIWRPTGSDSDSPECVVEAELA